MDTLTLVLSTAGALSMLWAYWAFGRYYDQQKAAIKAKK